MLSAFAKQVGATTILFIFNLVFIIIMYPFLSYAAGFDFVIVESVGLGQSEVDIDMAVDMLLVIVPPGGGDGLQVHKNNDKQ
jgi:hypothetical protein